jgi:hypothetical protein
MRQPLRGGKVLLATAGAMAIGWMAVAQSGTPKLFINGKLASSRLRVIGGVVYVPAEDVASAQGMQLAKRSDGGYNIQPAGGANQLAGRYQGKIGEKLFTGQYALLVKNVENVDSYKGRFRNLYGDIKTDATDDLIVVSCTISNGLKTQQNLVVDDWEFKPKDIVTSTSLADTNGQSYPVHKWDVKWTETAPGGVKLLPGAASDFALVFKVTKGAQPKDLIFSFLPYDKRADQKPVDVRISLQR